MKTIFRYTNMALLTVALLAAGAIGIFAQDAADADGLTKLGDQFRAEFADKTLAGRKKARDTGKAFLEKYGTCEPAKELADYLKGQLPKIDTAIKAMEDAAVKDALIARFDGSLKSKTWDETYASGKELLAKYPEDFRVVEIVLAAIGGEEAFKANYKYNDEAIRYAKQSIADLEAGKAFMVGKETRYGLASSKDNYNFAFLNKDDAIAWMNLYIGYITGVAQKNKSAALPYVYKASQATNSDAAKNVVSYDVIGNYYIDELNKVYDEIQALAKTQSDTDAADVAQKKVDDIKAKVAFANGLSERAMDAFARANKLATDPAVKTRTRNTIEAIYKRRFEKTEGVDAWIATAVSKPFINPTTPVTPITDPEPVKTTGAPSGSGVGAANGTGVGAANGTGIGAANGTGVGGAKPAAAPAKAATTPAKPAATPAKPGAIKN